MALGGSSAQGERRGDGVGGAPSHRASGTVAVLGELRPLGERCGGGLRPSRERHGGEARWAGCWSATARSKSEAGGEARLVAERRRGASRRSGRLIFFIIQKFLTEIVLPQFFYFGM